MGVTVARAVVLREAHTPLEVEELEVASPKEREMKVRIAASGVCHSDLHAYEAGAGTMLKPIVFGHEAAGEVVELGPGVSEFAVGDHVVLCVFPQCGVCTYCADGHPTLCLEGRKTATGTLPDGTTRLSLHGEPVAQLAGLGTWSTETVISTLSAVRIDTDMPLVSAALLGCGVVTGYGAVTNVAGVRPGETMAVIGCGGLGLSAIQAGRIAGAERIIAIDVKRGKLELGAMVGATDLVDSSSGNLIEQVQDLTGGNGVNYALDFVGVADTARDALSMTRRGGTAVLTGLAQPVFDFSINELIRAGRTIKGNLMGMGWFKDDFARLVSLYQAGELMLDELVSQRLDLSEVEKAFEAMHGGEVARSVLVMS